jgi:hypothetical protein
MKNFKEASEKEPTPSKSLNDLITLIFKLNDKIREKISPRSRAKKEAKTGQTEVVIIIMTNKDGKVSSPAQKRRPAKGALPKAEWIDDLCREIEREISPRKKS